MLKRCWDFFIRHAVRSAMVFYPLAAEMSVGIVWGGYSIQRAICAASVVNPLLILKYIVKIAGIEHIHILMEGLLFFITV